MNTSTFTFPSRQLHRNVGDAYLRLQLDQKTEAALPMKNAQEVISVAVSRLTPMPNMTDCILGLLNQRSRVFWVVDLAQMLNFEPLETDIQQYNIAIVRAGQIPLGLVVREVKGVMRLSTDVIQSPIGNVTSALTPYLRGCVLEEKGVLLVLDAEAIINSSALQSHL